MSSQQLLERSRSFKNDLTAATVAKFDEFGITDTANKLDTKINVFEAARIQQNSGKSGGVAATAQTKATFKNLKNNRRSLKVIGENILEEADDPAKLAAWQSACRVEKTSKTKPAETPSTPNL
jgi:ERCC4-type nuclease